MRFLRGLVGVCLVIGCALLVSCRTVENDTEGLETQPWNTPAGWEGQIMGVPY